MRNKRNGWIVAGLAGILMACCLLATGCDREKTADNGKIQIVATVFPEYDWTKNVLGDNPAGAELTLLIDKGVDLHSYQPTTDDILKISTCDLLIYVGGESDAWVESALQEALNKDMIVIDLLDVLGERVKEEEITEGMEEEEEEEGAGEAEPEYDEHVWLSLRNTAVFVNTIAEAMQKLDPDHADLYRQNAGLYNGKLDALDKQYEAVVSDANVTTLLFGDRFPFRYLTDDYGLSYYAAFPGCMAETEASFETITFLAKKVDELDLGAVFTIDGSDGRIAKTIIENTQTKNAQILMLDSMQSVTDTDIQNGTTYLSVMEENLKTLKAYLQGP
ncbi:MAG: zinc ABC transporter substrate-binding protein [Lachnospiraceae bacterium]|nr:zinc ABC transporter substrate-binding protein [Lachnospiraceae bacterium]